MLIDRWLTLDGRSCTTGSAYTTSQAATHKGKLHIVVFTYTRGTDPLTYTIAESCYADTIVYERKQHVALIEALIQAGWTIHSPRPSVYVHILVT